MHCYQFIKFKKVGQPENIERIKAINAAFGANGQFAGQRILTFEGMQVETEGNGEGEYGFGITIRTPAKSFTVYAGTDMEREAWILHLNACINCALLKEGSGPKRSVAPVWVPDKEAVVCMHCNKTKFNQINRKHHCRKCGRVVCNSCSNKKAVIRSLGSVQHRVCDSCFAVLRKVEVPNLKKVVASDSDTDDDDDEHEDRQFDSTVDKMNSPAQAALTMTAVLRLIDVLLVFK